MHKQSSKCAHCKKAFLPIKADQKYCSAKCRQASYRSRKTKLTRKAKQAGTLRFSPAVCLHCGGTFWAKTKRACYCSVSCRTLAHRHMRQSLAPVIETVYRVHPQKVADLLDTMGTKRVRSAVEAAGYIYSPTDRQWVFSA
jgi:hypothetical protein